MLNFISFGSGSSGNCYFFYSETDGLMIDAGIGPRSIKRYFQDYNLSLSSLRHVLITHDHADHVKSAGSLSLAYHLPVYATSKTFHGINNNPSVHKKIAPVNQHIIECDTTIMIGDFEVTPFSVPHDSEDSVGFFISYEGIDVCLMTDLGHVADTAGRYISLANYLIIEANHDLEMLQSGPYPLDLKQRIASPRGHLNNDDCASAIARYATDNLRHIWLCHLSEENNKPEKAQSAVCDALAASPLADSAVRVSVLNRRRPTGVFQLRLDY